MTIIMGVNLSDRVYVAGDSRLSYEKDGETFIKHDNLQKVEGLKNSKGITIASAGVAKFAQYIHKNLSQAEFVKENISTYRDRIEKWLIPVVDNYYSQGNSLGDTVTLIFGGTDSTAKKIVNGTKVKDMLNAYTGGQGRIGMKPALHDALGEGRAIPKGDVELKISDTKLFSVSISQRSGIVITDTKWGEFLMYGPEGFVKDDIQPKDIAQFEFSEAVASRNSDSTDMALMNGMIYHNANAHNLISVGGSVVTLWNSHDGYIYTITGRAYMAPISEIKKLRNGEQLPAELLNQVTIENGRVYRVVHGTKYRLTPVSKYRPDSPTERLLI